MQKFPQIVNESKPLLNGNDAEKGKLYGMTLPHTGTKHGSDQFTGCWVRRRKARDKLKYYKELQELQVLSEYDRQIVEGGEVTVKKRFGADRYLARIALVLNTTLLFVNLFASISTGSLAILNTFVDSCVDITTSAVLAVCLWSIHNTNRYIYPRGRESVEELVRSKTRSVKLAQDQILCTSSNIRLELLGVILCSVIMVVSNIFLVLQSVEAILTGEIAPEMNAMILSIMLVGSFLKTVLMVVCYRRGSPSSKVLAMDMRNDVATSLVAIVCATVGTIYWPYADPVGGIIVCGLIAASWLHYALEHVPRLVGVRAEKAYLSRILKVAIEHDDRIRGINHVMVYHIGIQAAVELNLVVDGDLPLKVTRDISYSLQKKLLKLDFVERADVHCDYDCVRVEIM